ncbi:Imm21 family immunity protein [Microbispora bryophytorum]|uniref:Imm21 family immunity protein n=1 Tax=Microbispora bryophytorum TaxID=1460882 RepID=UPI003724250F
MTANDSKHAESSGLTWVSSLGGPHILVPQAALPYWHGTPRNYPEDEGDYGRACSVPGYIGLIRVGPVEALVKAEPSPTTFLAERRALISWVGAYSEEELVEVATEVMDAESVPEGEELTYTVDEPLILFDSAYGHDDISSEEHLVVDLAPGRYTVRAAYVEHPRAYLILVQFT